MDRHIELDGDCHSILAKKLVASLCKSEEDWQLAEKWATFARFYKYFYLLIFLNFFTLFSADPQFTEFSGEFLYDFDIKLNELYTLNEKLELSTYKLSTNSLKGISKIKILRTSHKKTSLF